MAPPWPELYAEEEERRLSYLEALREYGELLKAYTTLGYDTVLLPQVSVAERGAFVLSELSLKPYMAPC
jgi:predicted ATPase